MTSLKCVLKRLGYKTGTDTAGADLQRSYAAVVFDRLDLLEIWIPHGTGLVISMADVIPKAWPFSTNFAFS